MAISHDLCAQLDVLNAQGEDRMGINDRDPKNYPRWNGHMGALGH
jgi:hypothetical protein